jgi:hypothetical protein
VCPGHFWLLKFGKVPGTNSYVEKNYDWLPHTQPFFFFPWHKALCADGFDLREVIPLQLEMEARSSTGSSMMFLN